tara:strand:- start:138 stop:350 length:213 start_codon:yes stop_codon:yes gene_type:complete
METCVVGTPCPHGMDCDHVGAGRSTPQVVNVTSVEDKVIVTIRFPHGDEIFLGSMEDVMLNMCGCVEVVA